MWNSVRTLAAGFAASLLLASCGDSPKPSGSAEAGSSAKRRDPNIPPPSFTGALLSNASGMAVDKVKVAVWRSGFPNNTADSSTWINAFEPTAIIELEKGVEGESNAYGATPLISKAKAVAFVVRIGATEYINYTAAADTSMLAFAGAVFAGTGDNQFQTVTTEIPAALSDLNAAAQVARRVDVTREGPAMR
jgi:hypothetical protein